MPLVKDYYHDIDLHANQLFNSRLHNITTANRITLGTTLGVGDKGYQVYDIDLLSPYFWDGTQWLAAGGGGTTWGSITGTLTAQTDLTLYLAANYYPLLTNPAGYITSSALTPYLTSATAALTYEPIITAGTTSQYWRGDKTWQTFPTIPAAQIQSDWNQTNNTLLDYIKNKPTIPTVGTWGALNYPTWTTGTPFVKMDAVGSFTLDTNTYLTSAVTSVATSAPITGGTITGTGTIGITQSSASADGYLSSTNWTTFNNKFDLPALTSGSVLFSNGTTIAQDNANFFWNDTDNRLGIGTATPAYKLDVQQSGTLAGTQIAINTNGNLNVQTGGWGTNTLSGLTNYFSAIQNKFYGHIIRDASWSQGDIIDLSGNAPVNDAQGWNPILLNTGTVARASGTASSTMINLQPAYNYTGTYTGITRGIYYAPILTSLNGAPHRAWENTSGDIIFGNLATGGAAQMVTADTNGKLSIQTIPSGGGGTVTSIATSGLISGGTITTSGTISTSMATGKLVGRSTAGTGVMEEITVGSGLTLTGAGVLNNTATPTPLGYYGAFSDVTSQTATLANTGYPMLLGVTDLSNGVTVVSGSRVTIANTGIYNIQWSAQFSNPTSSDHDVTIWLRKNGVDVPGSAGIVLVPAKHGAFEGHVLPSWNFLLDVVGGNYYEFVWSTNNANVYIAFNPAGSPPPSTASVVLTVTQQSGIMAGTGITAINSLTGAVQTLTTGTSGLAPLFTSAGTTHTLDIPLASGTGVTAGLLSNTDYNNFGARAAGGSFVSYYFNGSVAASVATYYQMSPTANIAAAANFTLAGNGLISQWLTDVGNPNRIEIPAGNWNFEMYMSASSTGGTPAFYVELLKYNGVTFTSIASSSAVPKNIVGGTSIDLYLTSLAIPQTTLLVTDRLAIRVYIVNSVPGRSVTMYTQNTHVSEVITNFAGGISALNGLTVNTQYFATGTSGTDFAISSTGTTHTFNIPDASATNRGVITTGTQTIAGAKTFSTTPIFSALTAGSVPYIGTSGQVSQNNSNFFWDNTNNRLGIGTASPIASSIVDITSTTQGLLIPRMSTGQRDLISSPATGLQIYNTTLNATNVYNGTAWENGTKSGTYQPTITSVANLDAVSISVTMFSRNNNVVTISGRVTMDPSVGGQTTTRARFTLPFSSNFIDEWDCAGVISVNINTSGVNYGILKADTVNDQAEIFFYPSTTASFNYFFTAQYVIK